MDFCFQKKLNLLILPSSTTHNPHPLYNPHSTPTPSLPLSLSLSQCRSNSLSLSLTYPRTHTHSLPLAVSVSHCCRYDSEKLQKLLLCNSLSLLPSVLARSFFFFSLLPLTEAQLLFPIRPIWIFPLFANKTSMICRNIRSCMFRPVVAKIAQMQLTGMNWPRANVWVSSAEPVLTCSKQSVWCDGS